MSPIYGFVQMEETWRRAEPAFVYFPEVRSVVVWENVCSAALIVSGFIVGCVIWSGSSRGRTIARVFLFIGLCVFIVVESIVASKMHNLLPKEVNQGDRDGAFRGVYQGVGYFVIWLSYFRTSKRVKNTYGP